MDNLQRGRNRYDIFCIACHGRMAEGDGPVVGPNRFPAPPSLHTDQARGYDDGTIYYVITHGIGKMPGYADKLTPQDRWKVVHYVRALQLAVRAGTSQPAASQPGSGTP
jgi:mono/diheme cytochrome c family protein